MFAWLFRGTAEPLNSAAYRQFWGDTGRRFSDLHGAASTSSYFDDECRLFREHFPALEGCALLKTDLWNEAKNTRILKWADEQGAFVYGVDISAPTALEAKAAFRGRPSRLVVGDVRQLPFAPGSFDAIYSMGTIEHFPETEAAVCELARLLKPGGRMILGVPNKHDPFLRPLLVALLHSANWYDYGSEKSYSRRELRRMLEAAGLSVVAETGILFMPGWLRMLDLLIHTRLPRWSFLTRPAVQFFAWIARRLPRLRRHGYLLASVGVRSANPA
jgi:SAM-dependent methyltransferase